MPKITTFLTYSEQAEEAANFYVSIFENSRIVKTTYYTEAGPAPAGTVMTVTFELDGQTYVALNGGPQFRFTEGISLSIHCQTQEEVDYYWEKLTADGGQEGPCGWLTDKFGLSWQVTPDVVNQIFATADPDKAGRALNAVMGMKKIIIADLRAAAEA